MKGVNIFFVRMRGLTLFQSPRFNDVIKEYVARLVAKGKPYKSTLVAAMRKLLIHLQSLLKKQKLELV